MRVLLLALVMLLAAACGDGTPVADEPADDDSPTEDEMDDPEDGDPPEQVHPDNGDDREEREAADAEPGRVTGTLGGDAQLEGGCVWIESGGERYEVMWPDGYTAETDPVQLLHDDEVVAEEGDELTVRGQVDSGAMTICQIGPVFQATKVELTDD